MKSSANFATDFFVATSETFADGGADLVWVVKGLFTTLGIDFDKVWEEVRASNMSKVSEGGKIKKRADGKILKPDTYFKPDIDRVLKEQGL